MDRNVSLTNSDWFKEHKLKREGLSMTLDFIKYKR